MVVTDLTLSLPQNYILRVGTPPVPSYLHLRLTSGLSPKTPAQAAAVTAGTWYGCYITYTDPSGDSPEPVPVAMGRIISDGSWYFHIVDMAVLPEHQRKGLGDVILKNLLGYIMDNKAEGEPYVNLLADEPGRKLYRRNGFVDAMPHSLGMVWERNR
ncbi:GNAT family N-acetyltransferase [Aspergillus foveolatus]|uniref:GNAT family N-acetyltransferase n=1 Tax=Aspergillus foveolatus TaxID=210207 RepID=UPI003CCD08E7